MFRNENFLGSILCIVSACLWGVAGTVGQFLFQKMYMSAKWLVSVRMLVAGIFLLCFACAKYGKKTFLIWTNKKDVRDLLLFSLLGMLLAQYGYFVAIDCSNAATATVLQYLAPIMLIVYLAFWQKKMPTFMESLAVLFALAGTFLLATHGNIKSLSISPQALFWGLISAAALAFYSAFPKNLLQRYNTLILIMWAMLLGGICTTFLKPFWIVEGTVNTVSILLVIFVVLFGAMIPYITFLYGVKLIGPTKSSLLASVEPISSTVVSVFWLHTHLDFIDYVGFALIIATVFLLSVKPKKKTAS